jgi:hypothetical protein
MGVYSDVTVEVLYFKGCPNSAAALELVNALLGSEGIAAHVRMVEVRDAVEAVTLRFLGSPSIRIDGEDVEPEARTRCDYGFMCRTYPSGGVPSRENVLAALLR